MKLENEYAYIPTQKEIIAATVIQEALKPQPKVEFIAQPSAGAYTWVTKVLRLTNPDNNSTEDFDMASSVKWPEITVTEALGKLGCTFVPPEPAPEPVVAHPYTGFPPLKPGQIMGIFGPIAPPAPPAPPQS